MLLSLISFPVLIGLAIAFGGMGTGFDLELGTWHFDGLTSIRIERTTLSHDHRLLFKADGLDLRLTSEETLEISIQQGQIHLYRDREGGIYFGPHRLFHSDSQSSPPSFLSEVTLEGGSVFLDQDDSPPRPIVQDLDLTLRLSKGQPVELALTGKTGQDARVSMALSREDEHQKHRLSLALDRLDSVFFESLYPSIPEELQNRRLSGQLQAELQLSLENPESYQILNLEIQHLALVPTPTEDLPSQNQPLETEKNTPVIAFDQLTLKDLAFGPSEYIVGFHDLALEQLTLGSIRLGSATLSSLVYNFENHHLHVSNVKLHDFLRHNLHLGEVEIRDILGDGEDHAIHLPEMKFTNLTGRIFGSDTLLMTGIEYRPHDKVFMVEKAEAPTIGGDFIHLGPTQAHSIRYDHHLDQLRIGELTYRDAQTARFSCKEGTSFDLEWVPDEDLLEIEMTRFEAASMGTLRAARVEGIGMSVHHLNHEISMRHLSLDEVVEGDRSDSSNSSPQEHKAHRVALSTLSANWALHQWEAREIHVDRPELILTDNHSAPPLVKGLNLQNAPVPKTPEASSPWHYAIDHLRVEHGLLTLSPVGTNDPGLVLKEVQLTADDLDKNAADDMDLALEAHIGHRGSLKMSGRIRQNSLLGVLDVELKGLRVKRLKGLLSRYTSLDVRRGHLGVTGSLILTPGSPVAVEFVGDASLEGLEAYLPDSEQRVFGWEKLTLDDISYSTTPKHFAVRVLDFESAYIEAEVGEDHHVKLLDFIGSKSKDPSLPNAATTIPASSGLPEASIGLIRMRKSRMDFIDRSLTPDLMVTVRDLEGTLHGLSTRQQAEASISLKGRLNRDSPMQVYGHVKPLDYRSDTDLTLNFNGLDLTSFDQYAGQFSGYRIERGKLNLDLHYRVKSQQLMVDDKAMLNRLTLGEKAGSHDSPLVDLAIWLLQDARGNLDLDLPITGDLQDPSFQLSDLYLAALRSIPIKLFYSPIGFIDDLIPREDLEGAITFRPGEYEPLDSEGLSLQALVNAYRENGGGVFEIEPRADPRKDRDALAGSFISQRLARQAQSKQATPQGPMKPADPLDQDPEARDLSLVTLLKTSDSRWLTADPNAPKNAEAIAKNPLKFAIEHCNVDEDEVRRMAFDRAQAVKDLLIRRFRIPEDAIFLKPSAVIEGADPIPLRIHYSSD